MNVLMFSPGYPPEMPFFCRGLVECGARVLGIGDTPRVALPSMTQAALSDHLQVRNLFDEETVLQAVRHWAQAVRIDRVECLWEPGMILAAKIREALGVPGMTVAETIPFRDKEAMKQVLDRAGVRTPRHRRVHTESECRAGAEEIGYPLIIKPIAGAGSADTHRIDGPADLDKALRATRHVPEVSLEEFVDGEEFTFDTICSGGEILYFNSSWYRPRPLVARTLEWVTSQTIALRDVGAPELRGGIEMGRKVLRALGFRTGFTHMEWYRRHDGEAVFGEIAARPPGARSTEIMNYACDIDVYTAWAEAVVHRRMTQKVERKYNAAILFKRAQGQGRIQRIEGLDRILAEMGEHIVSVDLLPFGAARRDWKKTLLSDGWIVLRHPHLATTLEMADRISVELQLYAG